MRNPSNNVEPQRFYIFDNFERLTYIPLKFTSSVVLASLLTNKYTLSVYASKFIRLSGESVGFFVKTCSVENNILKIISSYFFPCIVDDKTKPDLYLDADFHARRPAEDSTPRSKLNLS